MRVTILKDIPGRYQVYPKQLSGIHYDKRRGHQLYYQQGRSYGQVGDCCEYITHETLMELQETGYVRIVRGKQ